MYRQSAMQTARAHMLEDIGFSALQQARNFRDREQLRRISASWLVDLLKDTKDEIGEQARVDVTAGWANKVGAHATSSLDEPE
jgi:hypothetical protein